MRSRMSLTINMNRLPHPISMTVKPAIKPDRPFILPFILFQLKSQHFRSSWTPWIWPLPAILGQVRVTEQGRHRALQALGS